MAVTTPHFALPFSLSNGQAAVVEQDSPDDIANCVEAVLRYTPGWRFADPEFGVSDQTFRRDLDLDEIRGQIARYEPRAAETVDDVSGELREAHTIDDATRVVRVALGS